MIVAATLAAAAVSLAAIGAAAAADPKRRRAFGLRGPAPRGARTLAGLVLAAAGLAVALLVGAGGFFVWLGSVLAAGRCLVALPPQRQAAIAARLRTLVRRAPASRDVAPEAPAAEPRAVPPRSHPMAESGLDQIG